MRRSVLQCRGKSIRSAEMEGDSHLATTRAANIVPMNVRRKSVSNAWKIPDGFQRFRARAPQAPCAHQYGRDISERCLMIVNLDPAFR